MYKHAFPVFSRQQDLVCLQKQQPRRTIDVFDCSAKNLGFFTKDTLLQSDECLFSIDLPQSDQECIIEFSIQDRYMAAITESSIKIYELKEGTVHESDRASINSENRAAPRIIAQIVTSFELTNPTYDGISGIYISEGAVEDMILNSWVALQSRKFNTMHFILLKDLQEDTVLGEDEVPDEGVEEANNSGP